MDIFAVLYLCSAYLLLREHGRRGLSGNRAGDFSGALFVSLLSLSFAHLNGYLCGALSLFCLFQLVLREHG
jgi:drug/metabolite transporter (DMT)-like permease